VYRFQWR